MALVHVSGFFKLYNNYKYSPTIDAVVKKRSNGEKTIIHTNSASPECLRLRLRSDKLNKILMDVLQFG